MPRSELEQAGAEHQCFRVGQFGITERVACLLLVLVLVPMLLTSWLIETGQLVAGQNIYFAMPLVLLFLLIPVARGVAHVLINRDLKIVNRFFKEVKTGNYQIYFDLPHEKEDEDEFLVLLRNLTWMSLSLDQRQEVIKQRFNNVRQQYKDMEEKAFTDALTGMYNRRFLDRLYASDSLDFCTHGEEVSVIYIDCDRFKQVNDTLGHHAGDQLLRKLARCIQKTIRENGDIPLRLGGDEFAVILPRTSITQAKKIALRLRLLYNRIKFPCTSLSIGVATSTYATGKCRDRLESLFHQADEQAYQIKRRGGDGIACLMNPRSELAAPIGQGSD